MLGGDLISAGGTERLHVSGGCFATCRQPEKALQIAGDQNVHRGGHGQVEGAVSVVFARAKEIGKHVVGIGRTNKLIDGESHAFCDVCGKDIAEVTRGYAEVDLLAHLDGAFVQKVAVCRNVVNDLRCKTAPVDGVCAGEEDTRLVKTVSRIAIGEDRFYAVLRIVEIAADGADVDVVTALGSHLKLLYTADAVYGVEYHDLDAFYVTVSLKSRFSGVTGGCDEDQRSALFIILDQCAGQKAGHDLERHVLECGGGAVPQLKGVEVVAHLCKGGTSTDKGFGGVSLLAVGKKLLVGVVRKEFGQHLCGAHGIRVSAKSADLILAEGGNHLGHKQTAVVGKALLDRHGGGYFFCGCISCALIQHIRSPGFYIRF